MQVVRCQAFASASAFAQLGSLIAPWLAKYDGAGYNTVADPLFLLLPRHTTPHRHSPHYHHTRLASMTLIASLPRLTRHHTRQVLLAITLVVFTRLPSRRVASYSLSHSSRLLAIILVTLTRHHTRRVVLHNFPLSVPLRAALTMSRSSPIYLPRHTRHHTHQVLLAIILVKSYSPSYSSSLTRYHTRRVYSPA